MTDPQIVKYIDQMCEKTGDFEVKNIKEEGLYTLVVPVFNGELGIEQIATLDLEFSFDEDDVILHNFPKQLLSDEDYLTITESISSELQPLLDAQRRVQDFRDLAKKYGFKTIEESSQIKLCAKNTDNQWVRWISFDPRKDTVSYSGNTDHLNIWLHETRKDLTPEKCLQFVDELNTVLELSGKDKFLVKDLIDPEDWQEIAHVRDAYEDDKYVHGRLSPIDKMIAAAKAKAVENRATAKPLVKDHTPDL